MNITKFQKIVDKTDFEKIDRKTIYDTYVSKYNNATDQVQYLSVLITVADGLEKQIKNIESHISRDLSGLFQPLKNFRGNTGKGKFRLSEIGKKELEKVQFTNHSEAEFIDEQVTKLRDVLVNYLDDIKHGYRNEYPEMNSLDQHLIKNINNFQNLFNGFSFNEFYPEILKDSIYWNALYFKTAFHIRVLDQIIQQVTENNFNKLKTYSELSEKEKQTIEGKQGRPLDDSAPQSKIEKKVKELIEQGSAISEYDKKKIIFLNKNSDPKPTTISNFIVSNFPELTGELDPRSVFNRVKSAIDNMK